MSELLDSPCIELLRPRLRMEFTVAEYDAGVRRARSIGTVDKLLAHGLVWATGAPAVEELRTEKRQAPFGQVRIFAPGAYDVQMHRLLGIL
jgi:hypothetical protein